MDHEIGGELASSLSGGMPVAGGEAAARSGVALAASGPLIAAVGMGVFLLIGRSEVTGTLEAKGSLGAWRYQPDDCTSGQRSGFAGVELGTLGEDRDRGALRAG